MRLKHLNVIGRFQSGLKVFSKTYVIMTGRILRFQDVRIIELHPPSLHKLRRDKSDLPYCLKHYMSFYASVSIVTALAMNTKFLDKLSLPSRSFCSLRFERSEKRRLVEAAGVEPASEGIPLKRLRAYPGLLIFAWKAPSGQGLSEANLQDV